MYAIAEIGGKQYKVEKNMVLNIDKVNDQKGDKIELNNVLMLVNEKDVQIGKPYLKNVKVAAKVLGIVKGRKVRGIKFKKRKNYTRTLGHRAQYLQLKISEISVLK